MNSARGLRVAILVLAAVTMLSATGCAYMKNRGHDAMDIFDVGLTLSSKPQFSLYAGFNSIVVIGYSNFDGTMLGMGHRHVGMLRARQQTWGAILYGKEQFGYETFNPADPKSPTPWHVGWIGLADGPPDRKNILSCPKMIHLGWIGVTLTCKIGEVLDFIVGFTTIDFMHDDERAAPPAKT